MKWTFSKAALVLGGAVTSFVGGFDEVNRITDSAEELLVLTIGGERSPDVYAFSPLSLQETKVPNVSIARKASGAVYYNDTIVTCGGVSEDVRDRSELSTCTQYDKNLHEVTTTSIPSLPHALQYFSFITYRHRLLVIGGTWRHPQTKERTRSKTVYQLDNLGNGWLPLNNLTTARSSHKCTVIFPDNSFFVDISKEPSQDLYCFGGLTKGPGRSNRMEIMRYGENTWTEGVQMSMARSAFAATSYKSKIYVTGGKNNDNEIEDTVDIYDVRDEKWRLFAPKMSMKRYYHTCFYLDGYLFLRGGTNKQDSENAKKSIELISIDKFTGTPGTEFLDFHTRYEGKSLHSSVIVPRNFLPVFLKSNNAIKLDESTTPDILEQWEDDEVTMAPSQDQILYGQVEANSDIGNVLSKHYRDQSIIQHDFKGQLDQSFLYGMENATQIVGPTLPSGMLNDVTSPDDGNNTSSASSHRGIRMGLFQRSTCMAIFILFFTSVILNIL